MAVFRIEKTRDYTVMSNHHLRNAGLSLKSKGLLSMMLSLPEDWNYTTRGLAKICKEGTDSIGSALKELERAEYIVRNRLRDSKGKIVDVEYVIYETPHPPDTGQPCEDEPDTACPDTENPDMDMKLTMKEKKLLNTYGCPDYHNTVTRLKWVTALTIDPEARCRMLGLARKMETEVDGGGTGTFTIISAWRWTSITGSDAACVYWNLKQSMGRICMKKLSKYEKETVINWNEAENLASIYTFNASLKRRLADFSRKYPLLCRLERSTPEGSVTYVIEKSRLSIRLVPPYSEERLAAAREYAKEHGFQVLTPEPKTA